ncbi:nucleoside triphosphate pyrophosphohydrolase family protein [Cryobacterium zhongshanensis]|uniref:Phosphoribosyl-ATP pyrophosphohydrolase n=1 Tax=Cryobacterium zhongshanensis TaxID=2928153 RepID=A0AA41UIJ7_9MICO|nr:nucleoside triphosphate pyrophosphohydrolase family protein [Cryobacterium zhongshanensis]MCI4659604.1 hypothetical protein [Cryobacterium zhongshanensis]
MTTHTLVGYTLPMQRDVALFHDAFGHPNLIATPGPLPLDRIELRIGLINEEGVVELRQGIENNDPVEIIDALIDTIYVTLGALTEMGADASGMLSLEHDIHHAVPEASLLVTAKDSLAANKVFLVMLVKAFSRQQTAYSIEILRAIALRALLALTHAGIDPQPFFDEVQRANMSKLGADGKPVHSRGMELDGAPEGKVLKGANYSRPDLASVYTRLYA